MAQKHRKGKKKLRIYLFNPSFPYTVCISQKNLDMVEEGHSECSRIPPSVLTGPSFGDSIQASGFRVQG